jgi:extradiol dioxygenase family protein
VKNLRPFHLAIPVDDITEARNFYGTRLGFLEGRSDSDWIDYNFFGHQLVCHLSQFNKSETNNVDGKEVPIPHFGIVLEWSQFEEFEEQLRAAKIKFIIEPYVRFKGLPGEQKTMFFKDPFGNALEFKSFKDDANLFAS